MDSNKNNNKNDSGLIRYLQKHYAPATVKEYSGGIRVYLMNYPGAEQAMYKDITAYIGALRNRYRNANTLRSAVCAIKVYYAYLSDAGIREDNPARAIRLKDRIVKDIQLQDLFSEEELGSMLVRAGEGYSKECKKLVYRNRVMMSLLIYQGLWPQEVAGLRVEDIDLSAATVSISASGKAAARVLSLRASQVLLFYAYIHEVRSVLIGAGIATDKLLIGLQGKPLPAWAISVHIKRCYRGMYKGRTVCVHTIRQSVISNLLKAGNDISVVQLFAGHICAGSTQRYEQSGVDSLQSAIGKYHPLR